jgi:nucleotide-binding universal stress UspA family protein
MVFENILVGVDGSQSSEKALKKAVELAKALNAKLNIVAIVKPLELAAIDYVPPEDIEKYEMEEIEKVKPCLKEAVEYAQENGIEPVYKILEGEPAEELMDYADENKCDLIIVGYRGKGGFKKLLLGSTAGNLVKYANQSVLVVK